ncbi:A disintegrin and metalloproteinase with thrombospondin motifs 2-like [Xenentodon cancila]
MEESRLGLLMLMFMLQSNCCLSVYISNHADSLHQVLSEFSIICPIRTNSKGRFLSTSVSAYQLQRWKRNAPLTEDLPIILNNDRTTTITPTLQEAPPTLTPSWRRHGQNIEEELFYNVTVFGKELHLRLRPNTHLIAPAATMEWEELGHLHSDPIKDSGCYYTGTVSDMENTSVAISNCDGLAGMIRTNQDEFFIEPLDQWRSGDEEERGRQHIIYRSSAIIKKQPAVNQTEAFSQSPDDCLRGPLLGSLNWTHSPVPPGSGSGRRRRYTVEAELFSIEVLLAVDYSVLLFHGHEHIQKYLLTLMNIINEIYQDHSLGANMNVVLVKIILLSAAKSQELISVGNPQKSLENVCGWSYLQHRELSLTEQHDHTIYLTRQEFGPSGMQGYAPVTGMCQLHRSCALVLEDGFTAAFVAAHETGHVLGMEHDGEVNDCADDVVLGSIMSPRVQATFYRYHWSRCSWRELHKYLHTYDCLRDDPFDHNWPAQPQLPGFQYSMDQQCRFKFGMGYSLCTAYATPDPCKLLWCSDYINPFFCKTAKGPPLDGTKCAPGKHCFKGFCMKLTPNLLRQDGGWGTWSPYGSCSRTCGGGIQFRTRRCDNPPPANGGRTCFGNSYEFQLCHLEDCHPLTDFREEQCKVWNPIFEHEGRKHHWLPYQHPDPDERCQLYCRSQETAAVVSMKRMVHDGTACSYEDAYSVCVRGECEHVGCDGQIASDQEEDRCGVCGGDNSSCKIVKGNFTRSTKKQGFLKIVEIPKGARHLLIQEFKGSPHVVAIKNQETDHLFLNNEDELPESRVVIEKGVVWEYNNTGEQESVVTPGPLKYSVLLMVRSHGDSKVTISYKYIIHDHLRSSLDSNLVQEDSIFYEWALKKWSHCSKPCGGGKQYTRFGCRRKADGKMVQRTFCSNINKPKAISRKCNIDTCRSPRWVSGDWEACSASCGQTGWRRRWVSCQQESSDRQQRSVHSRFCGQDRPESKQSCNRFPCPATWRTGPWTPCSVSCGNGTQERQVACLSPEGAAGNCNKPQPITTRLCKVPPCSDDPKSAIILWLSRSNPNFPAPHVSSGTRCRSDRSVFCRMEVLSRYCSIAGYWQMCCKSCSERNSDNSSRSENISSSENVNSSENISSSENVSSSKNFSSTNPPLGNSSSLMVTTETLTSITTSLHVNSDITNMPPRTVTLTPPPTSTDFVYVDYDDNYYEFSSYEEPPLFSEPADVSTSTMTTTTPRSPKRTAPTLLFKRRPGPSATVAMVTVTPVPAMTPAIPDFPTTGSPGGRSLRRKTSLTGPPLSSSFPLSKNKKNKSVDEVQYRIVGVNSDTMREQQNYFVPRMPPFRERTQNKRIQQLLKEKQLQDLLNRLNQTRMGRTDQKH